MSVKKGLGRGFDSLIPTELLDESFDPTAGQDEQVSDLRSIQLSEIEADPDQPRRYFDEDAIDELSASIAEHGILQPIVVVRSKTGYQIVAGERRYRAAKKAGLSKVPAIVRTLSDQHRLELSLIENLQRKDLNVLEAATAYLKLRDQFNLTLDQIGHRVGGRSVSAISNTLRLLRLPEAARQALVEGNLTEGQARPLINQDEKIVKDVLPQIIKEEWSARKIEQYVNRLRGRDTKPTKRPRANSLQFRDSKERLAKRLAADVRITATKKGAGQIVIPFKSSEDLRRLQKLLED